MDPARSERAAAQGKQLLLAHTVADILLHWFSPAGEFLGLERQLLDITQGPDYQENVERAMGAIKDRIAFRPHPIQVRKFESEEASIHDLPGEYQEFLNHPERYSAADREAFEGSIRKWWAGGDFVLEFSEPYWISADGEITHS